LAVDEDWITLGTAKDGVFGGDFYSTFGFKCVEGLERFRINDFEIQRSGIGIDGEFF